MVSEPFNSPGYLRQISGFTICNYIELFIHSTKNYKSVTYWQWIEKCAYFHEINTIRRRGKYLLRYCRQKVVCRKKKIVPELLLKSCALMNGMSCWRLTEDFMQRYDLPMTLFEVSWKGQNEKVLRYDLYLKHRTDWIFNERNQVKFTVFNKRVG